MEKEVQNILFEQLELLVKLSKSKTIEPEHVTQISLAMDQIAKTIIQCQALQGFCKPL